MNKDEFQARFRGRLLLFLAEAWSCRKEEPSRLGFLMDLHALELKRILNEMFDALNPVPPKAPDETPMTGTPAPNGLTKHPTPRR